MGGRYVAKERKEIESVTELGTAFEITFIFGYKPECLKTSNYPNVFKFKAEKKGKKVKKRKEKMIYSGKKAREL